MKKYFIVVLAIFCNGVIWYLLKHDYLNMYLTISLRNIDKIIYESLPDRHIYVSILWCEPHCLYWISILKIVKFTVPVIIFFLHFILTICSNIMHTLVC